MLTNIVFTFIGDDKPGLLESLSQTVADNGANWLESELSQLAGKFAGVVRISIDTNVDARSADTLTQALLALQNKGLRIVLEQSDQASSPQGKQIEISIVGQDRPGIVKEVAQSLCKHMLNVTSMSSVVESAAMSGEAIFSAEVIASAPSNLDFDALQDALELIAEELTLDISLQNLASV